MSLRIYGCWICYNNAQTIKYSIESVIEHVDELVVVDGSFTGETSDDGTWEIVESFRTRYPTKPLTHIKSKGRTLYEKHQEHVEVTGNRDPNVWTWQVDSDEIYLPQHAANVANYIRANTFNGIGVRLININAIFNGVGLTDDSYRTTDTVQMRIYRMHNGLCFKTKDGIFEHIVYDGDIPVQQPDNAIWYGKTWDELLVFNYHCLEPIAATIRRYRHYGVENPEEFARKVRSLEHNPNGWKIHPMSHIWRA